MSLLEAPCECPIASQPGPTTGLPLSWNGVFGRVGNQHEITACAGFHLCPTPSSSPSRTLCAHLTVHRARASMGSRHRWRVGSSGANAVGMSWQANTTVLTALTRRSWVAIRRRFRAPSMSLRLRASTPGITACSMAALSGRTTSNPWTRTPVHPRKELVSAEAGGLGGWGDGMEGSWLCFLINV